MSDLGKDVCTVLSKTNIHDVLNEHLQCGKGGISVRDYTCPFHELDGKPDDVFSLNGLQLDGKPGKFMCCVCAAKGTVLDFLMRYHGYTLTEAVENLMIRNREEQ